MSQDDFDGVLRAYSRFPGSRTNSATILEVSNWCSGMDPDKDALKQLFDARRDIAFAALAKRRLFLGIRDYTNFDTYELVVQRFQAGKTDRFAFNTRRRDGGTSHMWAADKYAFHRPEHVDSRAALDVDYDLLSTLTNLPAALAHLSDAILEFNSANTDDLGVPEHVEMVMTKSAFERLLNIGQNAASFQEALESALGTLVEAPAESGPMKPAWATRWKDARLLGAWARDLCVVRGTSAHGVRRNSAGASVWSANQHLAFASILFPLLVKKILADAQLLALAKFDTERLKRLESYLLHDPFMARNGGDDDEEREHPWLNIDTEALMHASSNRIRASLTRAYDATHNKNPE